MLNKLALLLSLLSTLFTAQASFAAGRTQLRNICHVKGQEENTLRGMGLVVGLNGTGEAGDLQTMRALSSAMEIMGSPVSITGRSDAKSLEELKKIKNVALVMVTATVPATGARRGEKLNCFVMALNGKSLAGGRLAFASLQGPNTQDRTVFALCQGQLVVDNPDQPMVARIHGGCQMQQDVMTPFEKDGYITLVLDHNHADFMVADLVGNQIQEQWKYYLEREDHSEGGMEDEEVRLARLVEVKNASNIRVKIPDTYKDDPVRFVAQLMEVRITNPDPEARVVINPRANSIVISGDVEIGDVIVTHRNLTVEASATQNVEFGKVDQSATNTAKLEQLVQALRDLKVPAEDIIEIIRGIDRNGKLHGKLVME